VQADSIAEVADLDIDDGPRNPLAFAGYESEPPPAPKLKGRGVVAMDITEQFADAAASASFFNTIFRSRADRCSRARCWSAHQGPVLYAF
jgi:hypothetical protein